MKAVYRRARNGDPVAIARVADTLRPRLARMAAHYARCTGENPDDLLQEAWLGLLEALPSLDTAIGRPEQYLLCRARWRLLDAVRRARAHPCAPLDEAFGETLAAEDPDLASAAWVGEFTRSLKAAQRAVLDCLLHGLTWREAGAALGCTSANIAWHVRQIQRRYEAWTEEAWTAETL